MRDLEDKIAAIESDADTTGEAVKRPFLISIDDRLYIQWALNSCWAKIEIRKTDSIGEFKFHGELPWGASKETVSLNKALEPCLYAEVGRTVYRIKGSL